jgi:hypothetical protein
MSFNDADQDTIVKVLADVLTALCKTNDVCFFILIISQILHILNPAFFSVF